MSTENSDEDRKKSMYKEAKIPLMEFHSQEAFTLKAKYEHIEKLIGRNHHNPTAGYHCEILIKEYLRANLPKYCSVDTGFIRCNPQIKTYKDKTGKKYGACIVVSPQIDILIHNETIRAPIYRTGDCVVIEPETVIGIIEVKKNLTKKDLLDSLSGLSDAYDIVMHDRCDRPDQIFFGIFAFDTTLGKNGKKFQEALEIYYQDHPILPTSITALSKFFSITEFKSDRLIINLFDAYSNDALDPKNWTTCIGVKRPLH
jgi:hypothetical protein